MNENPKNAEIYARITDTIFAVIVGLSFKEYYWLLSSPVFSLQLVVVLLGYLIVVISRVGYHKSISSKPYNGSKRFLTDLWILYTYVVLAFAPGSQSSPPNMTIVVLALVGMFAGYFIWDFFKKKEYPNTKSSRMLITLMGLFMAIIVAVLFYLTISLGKEVFFGGSFHDWLFLEMEFAIVGLFWVFKLKLI